MAILLGGRKHVHESKGPDYAIENIPGAGYHYFLSRLFGAAQPNLRSVHCDMFHNRHLHGIPLSRLLENGEQGYPRRR